MPSPPFPPEAQPAPPERSGAPSLVFRNGTVLTIDERQPTAESVAVLGNRIVRVGSNDAVGEEIRPGTRVVDLRGRTLLPGFNDNHTHPISFGVGLGLIDARPAAIPTLAGLQEAFRAAAAIPGNGRGDWLLARGYDDSRLDVGRHPTRHDLDAATGRAYLELAAEAGNRPAKQLIQMPQFQAPEALRTQIDGIKADWRAHFPIVHSNDD